MLRWKIQSIELPLKFNWKIARNETEFKKNYLITVEDREFKGRGEVAYNVRFNESDKMIEKAFENFETRVPDALHSLSALLEVLDSMEEINLPNSLRFGIEAAFVEYLSLITEQPIQKILGVNQVQTVATSFSIPILPLGELKEFIDELQLNRFYSLKVKIDSEDAQERIKEITRHYQGKLRIDANEAFDDPDSVIRVMEKVGRLGEIEFLEQPLKANLFEEAKVIKKHIPYPHIADESIVDSDIPSSFKECFDGVNIKLMKAGSYLVAIKQLRSARELGLKTMLGCMVETSLGISSALHCAYNVDYCDLDGFLFLKEDPFGLVSEENGNIFYSHLQ